MIRKSKESVVSVSRDVELGLGGEQVEPAYGLTMPLLTTASGEKFGKSAGNAVWLDATMTSPFDFYQVSFAQELATSVLISSRPPTQFFLRTTDEEVHKYLKIFSFIRVIEIEGIMADHTVRRGGRRSRRRNCSLTLGRCAAGSP